MESYSLNGSETSIVTAGYQNVSFSYTSSNLQQRVDRYGQIARTFDLLLTCLYRRLTISSVAGFWSRIFGPPQLLACCSRRKWRLCMLYTWKRLDLRLFLNNYRIHGWWVPFWQWLQLPFWRIPIGLLAEYLIQQAYKMSPKLLSAVGVFRIHNFY